MLGSGKPPSRTLEAIALTVVAGIAFLSFLAASIAGQVRQGLDPIPAIPGALLPPFAAVVLLVGLHVLLRRRRIAGEQIIWPAVSLLLTVGLVIIWRLRGPEGVWQQILRGLVPGVALAGLVIARPVWIERIRRWAVPISLIGLALPFATAVFGVVDETGARLALKIGPLPAIQTSELIKFALIVFLAWYVERQGQAAEGRARPVLGWLRMPGIHYFLPGALFVTLATLALVQMSDYGAVLILGMLFIAMLYAGFETRIFVTVSALGLGMALLVGLVLAFTWEVPTVIQYRFLAFLDPWSEEVITAAGQTAGVTISEGPGYQIQQAIYAVISGGITGSGLGFGSPDYVPLAHSDFILAAIIEELGAVTGIALLLLFAVLVMRIFRIVIDLPPGQVFERLLLVGIGVHLFTQVFLMAGGTLNLLPLTGVTIPFLSQGGMALIVNLAEVGIALALAGRLESENP